jgi:hypothetical protein
MTRAPYLCLLLLVCCSKSESAPKLVSLDLSSGGLSATIDAAEGAVVTRDKFMPGVMITASSPKGYALSVFEVDAKLAQEKADCSNAPHKNCELVSEASDAIVTKWVQFGRDNYKVVVAVGPKLSCETATLEAKIESKAVADSVLVTCRSLKLKRAT